MKISTFTTEVFKNFANINPNIVIKPGQPVKTISPAKSVLAEFTPEETFPQEFGIYDLNEFLASVNLVESADLEFEDKFVTVSNSKQKLKYFFSEPSILTSPAKSPAMPDTDLSITITEDQLNQIRKVASVLGHTEVAISGTKDSVSLKVLDTNDNTANTYEIDGSTVETELNEINFVFLIANLKVIPGDYKVNISSKLISSWEHASYPVKYYIALERNSTTSN